MGTASIQDGNMEVPEGPFDVEIVMEAETQEKQIADGEKQVIEEQEKEEKICEEDMHEDKENASNGRDEEGNKEAEVEETDNKIDANPKAAEETEAFERTVEKVETLHENLEKETENVEPKGKATPRRRSTRIRLLSETSNAASGDETEVQASTKSRTARLVDNLLDQLNTCT